MIINVYVHGPCVLGWVDFYARTAMNLWQFVKTYFRGYIWFLCLDLPITSTEDGMELQDWITPLNILPRATLFALVACFGENAYLCFVLQ